MSWAVGFSASGRFIGYGVPAICDHPDCDEKINRGLAYACADGLTNCEAFLCDRHKFWSARYDASVCKGCRYGKKPLTLKPDVAEWISHVLEDESWHAWRIQNPQEAAHLASQLDG